MAFDGITIHALVNELNTKLSGGRLNKIAQTEKDEILCTIKAPGGQLRLLLSVNPTLPLAYITSSNKPAPLTAPMFCMLLRKHINNGRIIEITQPGLERIICIKIEHLDELGDLCTKYLIVELMGKHSNIIFTDENHVILDSIKRIHAGLSSVREVLPGRDYFIPNTANKRNPLDINRNDFVADIKSGSGIIGKSVYRTYTGISPVLAEEICERAGIDSALPVSDLSDDELLHLGTIFCNLMDDVKSCNFDYNIYYDDKRIPFEYSVVPFIMFSKYECKSFEDASDMLETYYAEKNNHTRIHQKSADLRQLINTILERDYKKYDLQLKQLEDTKKRDKYKIYGELLNVYGYDIEEGATSAILLNYYNNEEIEVPLDKDLSPHENSKKYFDKYNKLKRTHEALSELITGTRKEIEHLESILISLDIATDYDDLLQIREELALSGYTRKNGQSNNKMRHIKSKPLHYLSSDGYDIYVGKNNIQNEELTFKLANGNDWWFHAKGIPGSHVIVKSGGDELPDRTFEEAAALAAYYSKGKNQEKVEIDYVEKKAVKKVNGSAPGFVIYHTNYSMIISPDISGIKEIG